MNGKVVVTGGKSGTGGWDEEINDRAEVLFEMIFLLIYSRSCNTTTQRTHGLRKEKWKGNATTTPSLKPTYVLSVLEKVLYLISD